MTRSRGEFSPSTATATLTEGEQLTPSFSIDANITLTRSGTLVNDARVIVIGKFIFSLLRLAGSRGCEHLPSQHYGWLMEGDPASLQLQ